MVNDKVEDQILDDKFHVTVNHQPVLLEGEKQTGASIKRAAIEQGVNIRQDFLLNIELDSGETKLIRDDEEILVIEGERFLTVENDDKFHITVNNEPVVLEDAKQTGASIKEAAIEQGVNIKQDFLLRIELDSGETKLVGDKEEIVVRESESFLAVEDNVIVNVEVNHNSVVLNGEKQTGASIKEAAIEQGVNIKQEFVLSIELGSGKTKLVGDNEEIVVSGGERFLAIENDDNS